jgi:AraC-like DNA-binding protein
MSGNEWQPPVRFFRAGRQKVTSRDYRFDCRSCEPEIRRILIKRTLAGEGVLYAGGRRVVLEPGWIFVISRPGDYQYAYEGDGAVWAFEYVSLILPGEGEVLPQELHDNPAWDAGVDSLLCAEIGRVIDGILAGGQVQGLAFFGSLAWSAAAYRLFLLCVSARSEAGRTVPEAARRLREYLQNNWSRQVYLADLARRLEYTPEALSRLFKTCYGQSPQQYLNELRLERARQMLEEGGTLKEVARLCGFSGVNYLCRCFRAKFKITPGEYRRHPDPLSARL